jgi:glycoside/pentoside/hexuronide:cation symporter, GPH family
MNSRNFKISVGEKIGYAMGDAGTNIAWRTMSTFLLIFYTDVFGLAPAAAGVLLLIARLSDGVTDIIMGIIGDRTRTKRGQFRPWILWTAIPFGLILALTFTTPPFNQAGKLIYAYVTYILYTLIYTASNVPYGALMGVMTSDDKERTSLSSFRFAGAYFGGILTQGLLIYLVLFFGNVNPTIKVDKIKNSEDYIVTVTSPQNVENAEVTCKKGLTANFITLKSNSINSIDASFIKSLKSDTSIKPTTQVSFSMEAGKTYHFLASDVEHLKSHNIQCINQKEGYQFSVYLLSALLVLFLLITYFTTKERVIQEKGHQSNVWSDLKDLITNVPWLILLFIGFIFCIYNGIKQGVTVMYFKRYLNNEALSALYMVSLLVVSGIAALTTTPMVRALGKKKLFMFVMLFSALTNALLVFAEPENQTLIFILGTLSEFGAGIMPVLFFAMLGDCADYSEWKNGTRATGLIFSAGTFAFKFGGGIAGAIIGWVLGSYGYNGMDESTIEGAIPAIKLLMTWLPALILTVLGVSAVFAYPLNDTKLKKIVDELNSRRTNN